MTHGMSGCGTHKLTQSRGSLISRNEGGGAANDVQFRGRPHPSQQMADLVRNGVKMDYSRWKKGITSFLSVG